jgi:hypothetical protein
MRKMVAVVAVVLVLAAGAVAAELVGVPGSKVKFTTTAELKHNGKAVKMRLTGVGLRTKWLLNIYAIGSYLQEGVAVRTPAQLAAVNAPKRLHLVMERSLSGEKMASAMTEAVRLNYPAPAFDREIGQLARHIRAHDTRAGDHILINHLPGVGLHVHMVGKAHFLIRNPDFSRAIWDIYLGPKNLGEHIKKGLVSRL